MKMSSRMWPGRYLLVLIVAAAAGADGAGAAAAEAATHDTPPSPSPPTSCKAFLDEGMKAMQGGDFASAEHEFRRGTQHYPSDRNMWLNLAVARATLVAAGPSAANAGEGDGSRFRLYCEARAAAALAARLGADGADELLRTIEGELSMPARRGDDDALPDEERKCPHADALEALQPVVALRRSAAAAASSRGGDGSSGHRLRSSEFLDAVRDACTPNTVAIDLNEEERTSGVLSAGTLHAIAAVFDACGVVAVRGAFHMSQIDAAASAQSAHFAGGDHKSGVELMQRGDPLRSEVVCPLEPAFTDVASSAAGLGIAELILHSADVELDTFSHIQSEPGSQAQTWHTDVDPLFGEHLDEGSVLLPPYGLVMVVPLIDVDASKGPTEFMVGSNLPPTALEGADESFWHDAETGLANPNAATLPLELPRGSALFFDLRTTHRGGANRSYDSRPILYASFVREWFQDRVNFSSRQSRWWRSSSEMKESERLRKLYSRLDSRRYTKMLEDLLEDRGVDVSTL